MTTTEITPAEQLLHKIINRTPAYTTRIKKESGATIVRLQHKEGGEPGVIFKHHPIHKKSIHITPSTQLVKEK